MSWQWNGVRVTGTQKPQKTLQCALAHGRYTPLSQAVFPYIAQLSTVSLHASVVVPTVVVDVVCAAVLEGGGPCVIGGAVGGAVEGTVGGVFVWVVDAVVGPVEVVAAVESVCVSEVPVEDEVDLLPGVLTANTVVDGVSGLGVVVAASVVVGGTVVVEGSSVTVGGAVVVVGLVVVMGGAVVVVGASVTVGGAVVVEGLSVD